MFDLATMKGALSQYNSVRFKEEVVGGEKVTIVSYILNDNNVWEAAMGLEARGITFNSKGEIISLPFQKFFNLNERPETQASELDFDGCVFLEKIDGSMITPALIGGKIYLKTKKSFYSEVAQLAQKTMPEWVHRLSKFLLKENLCPIFEFTHPDSTVVIDYGDEPKFTLLAIRDMGTGRYLYQTTVGVLTGFHHSVKQHQIQNIDSIKGMTGVEGFVCVLKNGVRVKIKTDWYLEKHRMLDVRERDLFDWHMEDKLDDMIPELLHAGVDSALIGRIQGAANKAFSESWGSVMNSVDSVRVDFESGDRRKVAEVLANRPNQKAVWRVLEGRVDRAVDIVKAGVKEANRLNFPLRSVVNHNF